MEYEDGLAHSIAEYPAEPVTASECKPTTHLVQKRKVEKLSETLVKHWTKGEPPISCGRGWDPELKNSAHKWRLSGIRFLQVESSGRGYLEVGASLVRFSCVNYGSAHVSHANPCRIWSRQQALKPVLLNSLWRKMSLARG